jgi:hypothetical protein
VAEFSAILAGTIARLRSSRISNGFWSLVILSSVCIPLLTPIFDATYGAGWGVVAGLLLTVAAVISLLFFVSWQLTRNVADYSDRKGAFGGWLGWSMLAYMPTIVVATILAIQYRSDEPSYAESIVFTLLPIFSAPLLVYASGRAIDGKSPKTEATLAYWLQHYWPLVSAYALVTVPATLLSETLYLIDDESMVIDVAASLIYMPALVLGISLTVEAFHRTRVKTG